MKQISYLNAARFRFNRYPSHVILFVTARCNAKCNHCFYWREIREARRADELTLDEIQKISKNLGHVKFLSITGGEPSLRNDVPEIVHTFHENNGTSNVALHTNGLQPEKVQKIATRIVGENPLLELNLAVSVDALHKRHDWMRGVKGAFEKAIRTIELVTKEKEAFKNLNVTVDSCYTHYNEGGVKEMIDHFYENYDIDGYDVGFVRGNTPEKDVKNVDRETYRDVVSYLNEKNILNRHYGNYPLASFRRALDCLAPLIVLDNLDKGKMVYPCKAGQAVIVISEKGEVLPCEILGKSFGNLRNHEYEIKMLLFSPRGERIKSCVKNCDLCCTWECAIMNNVIFNWRAYPRLLFTWLQLELKRKLRTMGEAF